MNGNFKFTRITSNVSVPDINTHKSIKKRRKKGNSTMINIHKQIMREKHNCKGNNFIQDFD